MRTPVLAAASLLALSLAAPVRAQTAPVEGAGGGASQRAPVIVVVPSAQPGAPNGAWVAPGTVVAQPGQPVIVSEPAQRAPAEEEVTTTGTNWALVAPGIGLLVGGWAIGWLTTGIWNLASANCSSGSSGGGLISTPTISCAPPSGPYGEGWWQMAIPLVGPWLTFLGDDTFRGNDIWFPVLIGVMQPIGLGLLIAGLATPRTRARRARPPEASIELVPTLSGLMLQGTF